MGQANDYTAISRAREDHRTPRDGHVLTRRWASGQQAGRGEHAVYDLVYLKRPKLGTPYDTIAKRVADLICKLEPQGAFGELGQVTLSVDGTGVGRGVVDILRADLQRRGDNLEVGTEVDFRPVSITGSNTSLKKPERTNGYWSVPKKDLVFPAVAALPAGKIRIAKGINDSDALVHELKNYSRKPT